MKALTLALLIAPSALWAAPTDQAAAVRAALAAAGQAQAQFTLPTRPLPPCDAALTAAPHLGGWSAAELVCPRPQWRRIVPLTGATAAAEAPTPAADLPAPTLAVLTRRPVAKGSVLGPDDLKLGPRPDRSGADGFDSLDALIGRRTRQALSAGQPVLARQLQADYAVLADRPVELRLTGAGVSVSLTVLPLENGEMGQMIRLRHPVSGRLLRARVAGPDFVILDANTN